MKYLYFLLTIFISFGSLSAQREHLIINRSEDALREIDMSGINYNCQSELLTSSDEFAAALNLSGGQSFKVIVHSVYPISTYIDEEAGINASEKIAYNTIKDEYDNYLLFIIVNGKKGKSIKLYSDLDTSILMGQCKVSQDQIRSYLQKELDNKVDAQATNSYYCLISDIVQKYKRKLQDMCTLTQEEDEQWYIENGFDIFDVSGQYEFVETSTNSRETQPLMKGSRNCFSIVDLGRGRYKKNGIEYSLAYLLEGTDATDYPAMYLFTSGYDDPTLREIAIDAFNNSNPCDIGFWINIPRKSISGKQKIYLKTTFYNKKTAFNPHTIESLQQEFEFLNGPLYANLPTWDFQFKNHKDQIIAICTANGFDPVGGEVNQLIAGFIAGFADSLLNDIKFIGQALGAIERLNRDLTINGIFSNVTFKKLSTKQSVRDVIIGQLVNSYLTVYELSSIYVALVNNVIYPGNAINAFIDGITSIIVNSFIDLTFQRGSFEAGYTAGQAFYLFLGVPLVIKGAKALKLFLIKPKSFLTKYARDLGDAAGKAKVAEALGKAGVVIKFNLLTRFNKLGCKNLEAWYASMDDLLKQGFQKWPVSTIYDDLIKRLNNDIIEMPKLKNYLNASKENGLQAWRYLEDVYPNRIWCIP